MHKNQQGALRADALGAEMEGVCRDEGRAVFVPGLLPGEEGLVRIVKEQKHFAFGRLMAPPTVPSPDRREPDCPAYPRCGGCSCRHMTYEATLRAKQRHVADCFERIGHMQVNVPPVLGMEHPFAYRNKTALPVGGTAEHPQLGFFAPRSHALIPITDCPNAMPPAMDIARAFLGWMQANRIAPYVEETHTGLCRHLMIRVNRKGEAMVVVVVNGDALPHWEMLRDALAPLGTVSLILNRNTRRTNVILGPDFHLLWGRETLADILCGSVFELHPASFFQVNPMQTEVLYGLALDFADLRGDENVCDVYCGAGTISLMLARHCRRGLGIEIVPQAIENAKANAARNGVTNAEFRCGAAEELLPGLVRDGLRPDVIVVDPPRKGLEPAVITAMAEAGPEKIVYVSCDVATQARDAALLCAQGYELVKMQSVDMFCWTSGVENVMVLSKLEEAKHIDIHVDMSELDVTKAEAENSATYEKIKAYVQEHFGFKVSTLNIAQVKRKYGIIERECYNKAKTEDAKQPGCPEEKAKAIVEALRFFGMIK